jgi:hypothetical protein
MILSICILFNRFDTVLQITQVTLRRYAKCYARNVVHYLLLGQYITLLIAQNIAPHTKTSSGIIGQVIYKNPIAAIHKIIIANISLNLFILIF